MKQTYLERAVKWVESAEDVDIDTLESTISRFEMEHKKKSFDSIQNESVLKDLSETISYLQSELRSLVGEEKTPNTLVKGTFNESHAIESEAVKFDPSPLVKEEDVVINPLTKKEKQEVIQGIKNMPGIISAGSLQQSGGTRNG